ncbi:hypothetical protein J4462_01560 [Candidatus Pacearchaeota archaeon]|nr:hypothetical protein [Candidatus Pacearchaeota archaeon]
MKKKEKVNTVFILSLLILGVTLLIIGKTIFVNDKLFFIGVGLLSSAMAISVFETIKDKC